MRRQNSDFSYSPAQRAVFCDCNARVRLIAKGRRLGFTKGAAYYVVHSMLDGVYGSVLWGDTIHQNIRNYVSRYFMPMLKKIPKELWQWKVSEKLLTISGNTCDFRSADNPENWEGFGYDLIVLNEAGIILKNRYLWQNAVRPMMLDNPNSVAIIGGTPKGKGLFYELYKQAAKRKNWQAFKFSSYDNPNLDKGAIDEMLTELGGEGGVVRQEIYGDFIDEGTCELFGYELVSMAMEGETSQYRGGFTPKGGRLDVWGIDVARQGDDMSVIAKRRDSIIYELVRKSTPDLMNFADFIASDYHDAARKPDAIFVEINGLGAGLYDRLRQLGLPVLPADVGAKSMNGKMFNRRAEMYKRLKSALTMGLKLPQDRKLHAELCAIEYEVRENGVFKIASKDELKRALGYSPDSADACALSYFADVVPMERDETSGRNLSAGAW